MAAPSSTVSVTGAAPAPRPSDDGVVAYLVEVLSGGATLLQDAPLAVVSEAAGLMQEVPVVGIVCKTYLAFEQLVDTAKSNQGDLATLRDLCRDGITKVLENRKDHPGLLKKNFAKLEEHVLKAEELARRCNGDCTAKKIKRVVFARKISKDIAAIRSDILAFCEVATLALADDTLTLVDNINVSCRCTCLLYVSCIRLCSGLVALRLSSETDSRNNYFPLYR